MDIDRYRIRPGSRVDLSRIPSDEDGGLAKAAAREETARLVARLDELQEVIYAEGKHSVLLVLQAMDAGGKDSTIRHVLGPLNPQGCRVTGFKVPTDLERDHDFLWRVHASVPPRGVIGVFNRSHYEDVLIVRVKGLVPRRRWKKRYAHINAFEEMLHDEGVTIVKLCLHVSKEYQADRLRRRLASPDKRWKFNPADLAERARWEEYREAYEAALSRCSKPWAPWYVIPAERRWYRDLVVASILVETLEALKPRYPAPAFDPATIAIE